MENPNHNFNQPTENTPETKPTISHLEHLKEGTLPIIAVVASENQLHDEVIDFETKGENITYYYPPGSNTDKGWYLAFDRGFVISGISKEKKFTKSLSACMAVVAVGTDAVTGDNISFLTHQDSWNGSTKEFEVFLKKRFDELKDRCIDKTIDVVLLGGEFVPSDPYGTSYRDYVKKLSEMVSDSTGFKPTVIVGPKGIKSQYEFDSAYFDTETRRLFVTRPEKVDLYNDSFTSDEFNVVSEKWKDLETKPEEK